MTLPPLSQVEIDLAQDMNQVLDLNDTENGVVGVLMRPHTQRPTTALHDVLTALGKDRYTGRPFKADDDLANALAYMRAHRIQHVVLGNAQWSRGSDKTAETLHGLATACGATLTLVRDYNTHVHNYVERHGGPSLTWAKLLASLPTTQAVRSQAALDAAESVNFPADVPHVNFLQFRAECRRLLTPPEFKPVDRLYVQTFRAVQDALVVEDEIDNEQAARLFGTLVRSATQPSEAVVVARAMQAAALSTGWLMKIELRLLPSLLHDAANRSLSEAELRLLRRVHEPWKAAAAVLVDQGLSIDDILEISLESTAPSGQVSHPSLEAALSDEARIHIRAQRTIRLADAAEVPATLLGGVRHVSIRNALHAIRRDLQIPLNIPRFRHGRAGDRWQHRYGVSIQQVNA